MITVVLAAFIRSMASKSMRSPRVSRLEFGSSRTTRCGSPKNARARPRRWRNPRERLAPAANDDRIVRLRQPNDRLVKACQLCCFDDLLQIGIVQPCNDVLYRLSEEIDILRQISEAPAAAQIAHGQNVDAIEQDRTHRRSGDSSDDFAERGFAGAGWTNDAKAFTGRETERRRPSGTNGSIPAGRRRHC